MKMDDFFSSKFLKASDLRGREVTVRIAGVEAAKMQDGQRKAVMSFEGKEKTLVLNKVNASKLASAYGENMDDWAGKEVIIYPDETNYQGSMVPCLRLRVPQAAKSAPGDDGGDPWG
jgi:hypothetical protein